MTIRKTFQIKDLNNENIKSFIEDVRCQGIKVQQADIMNLAIELLFRNKTHEQMLEVMKNEHII